MLSRIKELTDVEHVLAKPDAYVGSCRLEDEQHLVVEQDGKLVLKTITVVPGLFNIFDEILTNVIDQIQLKTGIKNVYVDIDQQKNEITVANDGNFSLHTDDIEVAFGKLRSSTHYDEKIKKTTGGTFGIGAKASNILSTFFEVVVVKDGTKYEVIWKDNMENKTKLKESNTKESNGVSVRFKPDLERFDNSKLNQDITSLFHRRCYDIKAMFPDINMYFNKKKVPINGPVDYIHYIYPNLDIQKISIDVQTKSKEEEQTSWDVYIGIIEDEQPKHVGFVNGIYTIYGKHIDGIIHALTRTLKDTLVKTKKWKNLLENLKSPKMLERYFFIFVNAFVVRPEWHSLIKREMKTKVTILNEEVFQPVIMKFLSHTKLKSYLEEDLTAKVQKDVNKNIKDINRLRQKVSGFREANLAGHKNHICTLFITEGESASGSLEGGFYKELKDNYGILPVTGKPGNLLKDDNKVNTQRIKDLMTCMGLQLGKKYTSDADIKTLRYSGGIIIVTDQDDDGFHICGLIISIFYAYWPALYSRKGFIRVFQTPILQVLTNNGQDVVKEFFSKNDYHQWCNKQGREQGQVKYIKGLASNRPEHFRQYLLRSHLTEHNCITDEQINYILTLIRESKTDDEQLENIYNKSNVDVRKQLIQTSLFDISQREETEELDNELEDRNQVIVPFGEYLYRTVVKYFFITAVRRHIPSVFDGLKVVQRKIVHALLHQSSTSFKKLQDLSSIVASCTKYQHGQDSISKALILMTTSRIGSNNLPLLIPDGNFGNRINGGEDAGQPRYLSAKLDPIARLIFREQDLDCLSYRVEEGEKIEPRFFVPVVPIGLFNGHRGIGAGFSTELLPFKPSLVCKLLLDKIKGKKPYKHNWLTPWYRGFKGNITLFDDDIVEISGVFKLESTKLIITELPLNSSISTQHRYSNLLTELKEAGIIKSFIDLTVEQTGFHYEVKLNEELDESEIISKFKLTYKTKISNVHMMTADGIKKYNTINEILDDYYNKRLELYEHRKQYVLDKMKSKNMKLEAQVRFIEEIVKGKLNISNQKKATIVSMLHKGGYPLIDDNYGYLLGMPIHHLTLEEKIELENKLENSKKQLEIYENTTPKELWIKDIEEFQEAYRKRYNDS